ncbi:MAG: methyltransferase domain-containing protein [Woeseiaceae bacterium]|nr:methyltransferase domain-containing protein [Woeseiaceae bacterium]
MRVDSGSNSVDDVRQRFDAAAASFDDADYVHRNTCDGLLDRLEPVAINRGVILDLGAASGAGSKRLARSFPGSRVIGIDISGRMLARAKKKQRFFSQVRQVQADAMRLPMPSQSVDLAFANLVLPWVADIDGCFAEMNRVLNKNAVFAFASLGPDSMREFRETVQSLDVAMEICTFPDMHNIGDALMHAGLRDPVLDVDRLQITWSSFDTLLADLAACGAIRRPQSEEGAPFRSLAPVFPGRDASGHIAIELELVFGHAWGSGPQSDAGEFRIDPSAIGLREQP